MTSNLISPLSSQAAKTAALRRLNWIAFKHGLLVIVSGALLLVDLSLAASLLYRAVWSSHSLFDFIDRLVGGAAEAAWMGWISYFGWRLFEAVRRAYDRRRRLLLAADLIRKNHQNWYMYI